MMKMAQRARGIALGMLAVAIMSAPLQARAEGIKIATVDVQYLMADSMAGKSIQKQLMAERESIQKEAAELEQSLQAKQKELMAERGKLSPEDFSSKQADFEKSLMEARGKLQNRGRALDKAANDSFNELRDKISEIVGSVAQTQKIDLVLTRQNVVAAAQSVDVTEDVLQTLNKQVAEIKLKTGGKS